MSIINTIIAYNKNKILFEYTNYQGNFSQASRLIIQNIPDESLGYITSDNKTFFYVSALGVIYLCLTEDFSKEHGFCYLYDVKQGIIKEKYPNNDFNNISEYGLKNIESEIVDLINYYLMKPKTARYDNESVSSFTNVEASVFTLPEFINRDYVLTAQPKNESESISHNINFRNLVRKLLIYLIYY